MNALIQEPGWNDPHPGSCECLDCREAAVEAFEQDVTVATYTVQQDGPGYWVRLVATVNGKTVREESWLPIRHRATACRDAEKQLERLVEMARAA